MKTSCRILKFTPWACGVFVFAVGWVVLVGWVLDIPVLKSIRPTWVSMKANTAASFVFAGFALWLVSRPSSPLRVWAARLGAGAAGFIGALTLWQYLFGSDFGIDQLLFRDSMAPIGTSHPGRMAPATAINFILASAALLLSIRQQRWGVVLAQTLAFFLAMVGLLCLIAYAVGLVTQPLFVGSPEMAAHSALASVVLGVGILLLRPREGIVADFSGNTMGSKFGRRILPVVLVVLPAIGFLNVLFMRIGFMDDEYGEALLIVPSLLVLAGMVWWAVIALTRVETALQDSEARLRLAFDQAAVGISFLTLDGQWLRVNQKLCDIVGYSREELLERRFQDITHPEDLETNVEHVRRLLIGEIEAFNMEKRYVRKDGTIAWVNLTVSVRRDAAGEPLHFISIVEDIASRKRVEEALAKYMKDLARSNADLERFAYVASHDLQEPLRMVTSYVQLLARRYQGKLDPDADKFIAYAVEGTQRMRELINGLLTFARVGTKDKDFAPTDCETVLAQTLVNLQVAMAESGAVVTHDALPAIMADNVQMGQLFQNLIDNAIKFRGLSPTEIHVSARKNETEWVFSVRDRGIGIAPECHERIFAIFQRLHGRETFPGVGIGLALCRRIVERHGGRIWVESQVGTGSTFYFTVPEQR